ncbi:MULTISPECIES: DUF7714 family protein [unclassified Streptomyces]|uniref:DUF7714 family protein n=1 Tax=unclassified Streptomyces TaxID=2593676 RepID=UPI003D8DBB80
MTFAPLPARNVVPGRYRGVAVAHVDGGLDAESLRRHFLGREAYRRTRFIVVRSGTDTALLRVRKESEDPLFSPIVEVELLASPAECAFVHVPEADVAVPSALAHAARRHAAGSPAVVVQGRYEHVNFILHPEPLRIAVREVVPPSPAKLFDQARRILDTAEDLPPIELVPELIDLETLARRHPAKSYLLPCRGSGGDIPEAEVHFLDERPERADWTLLGCARSRQIHQWFYGFTPPGEDFCPGLYASDGDSAVLTKCCMQEEDIEHSEGTVSVPWGSSLEHVRRALSSLAEHLEPTWAPV